MTNRSSTVNYCVSSVYCLVNVKIFLSEYKFDLQIGSHRPQLIVNNFNRREILIPLIKFLQ